MTIHPASKTKQGLYSVKVSQGDICCTCIDKSRENAFKMARNGVVAYLGERNEKAKN